MEDRKRIYHLTELKQRRRDLRQRSTEAEKLLWERLRNNQLGVKFRRQFSVRGYVVDFYCSEYRLVIELLGSIHKNASNRKYDSYRRRYLESFGMHIVEFWNGEVERNIEGVIAKIQSRLTPSPSVVTGPSPQLWRGDQRGEVEKVSEL